MAVIRDPMPAFEFFQPTSVEDAQVLLRRYGADAWVLAGGLDSLDWLKDRIKRPEALDMADPETPVGARGVGEPPVGAGYGAVMNAIADAVGEDVFRRSPVTADIILMSLEHGARMHEPLRAHI